MLTEIINNNDSYLHPIFLIGQHIKANIETKKCDAICCISGKHITKGVQAKDALGGLFTNHDFVKFKSDWVAEEYIKCTGKVLKNDKGNDISLRNSSFIATSQQLILALKSQIREAIFNPPNPPFIIGLSINFKKHIAPFSYINYNKNNITISTDIWGNISVVPHKAKILYEFLNYFYQEGITKEEILSGEIPAHKIKKIGYENYLLLKKKINLLKGSNILKLIVQLLQKEN